MSIWRAVAKNEGAAGLQRTEQEFKLFVGYMSLESPMSVEWKKLIRTPDDFKPISEKLKFLEKACNELACSRQFYSLMSQFFPHERGAVLFVSIRTNKRGLPRDQSCF